MALRQSILPAAVLLCAACVAGDAPYPLWNGRESIAEYARRVNLPPVKSLDLGNNVTLELVLIPAGTFIMGKAEPAKPSFTAADARQLEVIGGVAVAVLLLALCVTSIKRRRFAFSLRWLIFLIAAAGLTLGGWARERQAITLWKEYEGRWAEHNKFSADEKPAHPVTISTPFYMGKYEVTQEQYEAVLGQNLSDFKGARKPVEGVSWDDALGYCQKLSRKSGKTIGLPTEAQWEYACRAGAATLFYFGDTIGTDEVNYNGIPAYGNGAAVIYRNKTTDVGSFKPNKFGLYDMHGNVCEWCRDYYDDKYYANSSAVDPHGPALSESHVKRGGSWYDNAWFCRSVFRNDESSGHRSHCIGFRIVAPLSKVP